MSRRPPDNPMTEAKVHILTQNSSTNEKSLRRDLVLVAAIPLASGLLFAYIELNERLFSLTRQWESLQIDEAPATLLVLACCLAWFAWRRYREARDELVKRHEAETRLAALLSENRRLARQYLQGQESERKSLARELHDELGQYLNAIKTDAVSLQKAGDDSPAIRRAASSIIRHADHLYDIVRDLIRELRPVALDDLGLRAALEHYIDHCRQRMPRVQFCTQFEGDLDALGEPVNLTIYRVIQEGVTNALRHADARRIKIALLYSEDSYTARTGVTFSITDDGRGADPHAPRAGLGLVGIRERVQMLGGECQFTTAPGCGFSIVARIPIASPEATAAS
ncbi:MAG TPA: histidine kinase [Steroidobacter sp.]|nr:histidine kinase [Steroidobacter sp.]